MNLPRCVSYYAFIIEFIIVVLMDNATVAVVGQMSTPFSSSSDDDDAFSADDDDGDFLDDDAVENDGDSLQNFLDNGGTVLTPSPSSITSTSEAPTLATTITMDISDDHNMMGDNDGTSNDDDDDAFDADDDDDDKNLLDDDCEETDGDSLQNYLDNGGTLSPVAIAIISPTDSPSIESSTLSPSYIDTRPDGSNIPSNTYDFGTDSVPPSIIPSYTHDFGTDTVSPSIESSTLSPSYSVARPDGSNIPSYTYDFGTDSVSPSIIPSFTQDFDTDTVSPSIEISTLSPSYSGTRPGYDDYVSNIPSFTYDNSTDDIDDSDDSSNYTDCVTRIVQQEISSIDMTSCLDDIRESDRNNDGLLTDDEYLALIQRNSQQSSSSLSFFERATFGILACQCKRQDGQEEDCCRGDNARVPVIAIDNDDDETELAYKTAFASAVCLLSKQTIVLCDDEEEIHSTPTTNTATTVRSAALKPLAKFDDANAVTIFPTPPTIDGSAKSYSVTTTNSVALDPEQLAAVSSDTTNTSVGLESQEENVRVDNNNTLRSSSTTTDNEDLESLLLDDKAISAAASLSSSIRITSLLVLLSLLWR